MAKILMTGASGFVGRYLTERLFNDGHELRLAARSSTPSPFGQVTPIGAIGSGTDWKQALDGCSVVIHLAGKLPSHTGRDHSFEDVNARGTEALVDQACESGAQLFIMMSTIAVFGLHASASKLGDGMPPCPASPYGSSKLAAERAVRSFASPHRTAVTLRPPMIYGSGASGNWRLIETLAASGIPLPFASIENKRSMLYVDNLVDAVSHLIGRAGPEQSGEYLIADDSPLSLNETISHLRAGMGRPRRTFPFPKPILERLPALIGRRSMAESLFGNLELDDRRLEETFGWHPPHASVDAMRLVGSQFALKSRSS